jgi:hypothetical protein
MAASAGLRHGGRTHAAPVVTSYRLGPEELQLWQLQEELRSGPLENAAALARL